MPLANYGETGDLGYDGAGYEQEAAAKAERKQRLQAAEEEPEELSIAEQMRRQQLQLWQE